MPVEPWVSYPPELNAGRLTAGAGSFSWDAAAMGWDQVAHAVREQQVALAVGSVVALLNWMGQSGAGTVDSIGPYAEWLVRAEEYAQKNAAAARKVSQSYNTASASMVPVGMITQNRIALHMAQMEAAATAAAALVDPVAAAAHARAQATIAEKEMQYAQYWQQNGQTMTQYDMEVVEATKPHPLDDPPVIVRQGGQLGNYTAYNPAQSGYTSGAYDYSNNFNTYAPTEYTPTEISTPDYAYNPGVYDSSTEYGGSSYTPGTYDTYNPELGPLGGGYVPGAMGGVNTSGSTYTPSRVASGGTLRPSTGTNMMSRAGSLIGRGGFSPNFGTQATAGALRATGGLGLGAGARPATAFGGVQNSPTAARAPLSTGMGMAPRAAGAGAGGTGGTAAGSRSGGMGGMAGGGAARRGGQSGSDHEGDAVDRDNDIFAGIESLNISQDTVADDTYTPDTYAPSGTDATGFTPPEK